MQDKLLKAVGDKVEQSCEQLKTEIIMTSQNSRLSVGGPKGNVYMQS